MKRWELRRCKQCGGRLVRVHWRQGWGPWRHTRWFRKAGHCWL